VAPAAFGGGSGLPASHRRTFAAGSGLPVPHRRTFAAGILPSALSMPAALRHPWLRLPTTPAPGHGQPLTDGKRAGKDREFFSRFSVQQLRWDCPEAMEGVQNPG